MNDSEEEDFYTFFNIPKTASKEEITRAYRRLSMISHPDRHQEPGLKEQADLLFAKIRRAYDVLSDPHKRAIYDTLGVRGLDTQGWELAERRFSPEEIKEEYERLRSQRDAQMLQERVNPSGGIFVHVKAVDMFSPVLPEFEEVIGYNLVEFPYVEVTGVSMQQSVEAPVTTKDRVVLSGALQTENGVGGGTLNFAWRRLISQMMWAQMELTGGEQVGASVRLVRTFSKHMFVSCQLVGRYDFETGWTPGIVLGLTRQLERRVVGSVQLKLGLSRSVTTSLTYDDSRLKHFVAAIVIGVPSSFVLLSHTRRFEEEKGNIKGVVKAGTCGLILSAGTERKVSDYNRIGFHFRVALPQGHLTLKLKFQRAQQVYQINADLCDGIDYLGQSFFWGVIAPSLVFQLAKLCLQPYLSTWREKDTDVEKARQRELREEKRREARNVMELMRETARRIKAEEDKKRGLVILEAWYGRLLSEHLLDGRPLNELDDLVVEVSVPLQIQVKDSKLTLLQPSKAQLPGFFDPCPGQEKSLRVVYRFRSEKHQITVKDDQPLLIPKSSHKI